MRDRLDQGGGRSFTRSVFVGAVLGSLVLLAATGLRSRSGSVGGPRPALDFLNLGIENNVASWWGGMLLLLASLYAVDCAVRERDEAPGARIAWLMISGILLFFSADEVSSFHERLGEPGLVLGPAGWFSARDILAGCLAGVAFFCLLRLWRTSGQRKAAVGLFLGFLILATVYPQETLEHRIAWPGRTARMLRLLVEEGTELLGSLVILRVTMNQAAGVWDRSTRRTTIAFSVLRPLTPSALVLGGLICVVLAVLTAGLPDQHRGRPADWLAASAFLAAGLLMVRPLFRGYEKGFRWRRDAGALICVVASALTVALSPIYLFQAGSYWSNLRLTVLAVLAVAFAATRPWDRPFGPPVTIVVAAAVTGAVAVGWSANLMLVYLFSQLSALVVFQSAATTGPV